MKRKHCSMDSERDNFWLAPNLTAEKKGARNTCVRPSYLELTSKIVKAQYQVTQNYF